MRFGIVTFPGSNCDTDAYDAVVRLGGGAEAAMLWHKDHDLQGSDVVILPGGFAHGDYLRAGAIARFSPIMQEVSAHAARGGPVLAICNGFQIACEAGLLPGALVRNAGQQFVSELVRLRVESVDTAFTNAYTAGQVLRMPIAHGEGRYVADTGVLEELEGEGRIVLRYVDANGQPTAASNPNGATANIAGIVNGQGNVFGLMPHPERVIDPVLGRGSADGLGIFESLLARVAV
jgi:phosphoribosylformylglycinamidine synthase subunit PurQ / glutaminase